MFDDLFLLRNLLCVKVRIFMYLGLGMSVCVGTFTIYFPRLWALYFAHFTHMPLFIYKIVLLILINSFRNDAISHYVETTLSFSFELSFFIIANVTQCILFRRNFFLNFVFISICFTLIYIAVVVMSHITVRTDIRAFNAHVIIFFVFFSHKFLQFAWIFSTIITTQIEVITILSFLSLTFVKKGRLIRQTPIFLVLIVRNLIILMQRLGYLLFLSQFTFVSF